MTFLEFQSTFSAWPVIPVIEIEKAFPGFDRNALTRWQKKGYLEKIRSGFYRLANRPVRGEGELFFIANRIYAPSYVSLQSALRWYDFIPEGVFTLTSVTTRKTENFQTPSGRFSYRSIRRDLFFGYRMEKFDYFRVKIADPAKALLDFLYLHSHLDSEDHFFELRLNFWELQEKLNIDDFQNYLELFASKSLASRAKKLIKFLKNNDVIV
jgi:predicted transcriptional regulator of viral defense system